MSRRGSCALPGGPWTRACRRPPTARRPGGGVARPVAPSTCTRVITPTYGCAALRGAGASPTTSRVLTRADGHAAAEQVAVAVDIVDTGHRAPVLGVDEARAGIRRLLPRVGMRPRVRRDRRRRMRRV